LLSEAWCRALARSLCLHPALARLLPVNAVATQCTLFEKSPQRNWLVSLHQDLSIPVKERVVSNELSGWSEKQGCVFVQPPVSVLESWWLYACIWIRTVRHQALCAWCQVRTDSGAWCRRKRSR
jgi:hypothetical protein